MVDFSEFENLARKLAPELSLGINIIEQPASMPTPANVFAYALKGRCVALRNHLKEIGRWQGVFVPTIIICDTTLDRLAMAGVILHEISHVLPARYLADLELPAAQIAEQQSFLLSHATEDPHRGPIPPWACGHDAGFIRRLCHLHYRALWQEIAVPITSLDFGGGFGGLSAPWKYYSSLTREMFELNGADFSEIEATTRPGEFDRLFESDVERWREKMEVDENV